MKIKIITMLIIIILIVFGIGYSFGSIPSEDNNFSVQILSDIEYGKAPLNVSFSSILFNHEGKMKRFLWDFNDGETSSERNTTHTFFRKGNFNVTVSIWNEHGKKISDFIEINVYEYYKPIASATSNKTYGKAPLSIQFYAEGFDVDDEKFEYQWDFDDGHTSNEKNPKHTFKEIDEYTVRLTIFDHDGQEDTDIMQINVVHNYPPVAHVSANVVQDTAPLTVQFYGESNDKDSDKVSYFWSFENTIIKSNSESTEQNPSHTFWFPGSYLVSFTVEDEDGDKDTDTILIVVTEGLFSKTLQFFYNKTLSNIVKGALGSFIGDYLGNIVGGILLKVMINSLTSLEKER
jgi:PKD repeat protein